MLHMDVPVFNRKRMMLHHDNARSHTLLVTRQKLLELVLGACTRNLSQPAYMCDLMSLEPHLFCSFQKCLNEETSNSDKAINQHLIHFLLKDRSF